MKRHSKEELWDLLSLKGKKKANVMCKYNSNKKQSSLCAQLRSWTSASASETGRFSATLEEDRLFAVWAKGETENEVLVFCLLMYLLLKRLLVDWLLKNIELSFRKETFTVADCLSQALVLNCLTTETVFLVSCKLWRVGRCMCMTWK